MKYLRTLAMHSNSTTVWHTVVQYMKVNWGALGSNDWNWTLHTAYFLNDIKDEKLRKLMLQPGSFLTFLHFTLTINTILCKGHFWNSVWIIKVKPGALHDGIKYFCTHLLLFFMRVLVTVASVLTMIFWSRLIMVTIKSIILCIQVLPELLLPWLLEVGWALL